MSYGSFFTLNNTVRVVTSRKRQNELDRLDQFPDLRTDGHTEKTGVLLSDEIEFYVGEGKLFDPYDRGNLKPAGYELTVGDEAMLGGKYYSLGDSTEDGRLCIPPFEVVVIKTAETLNLPRFLIARWNIRVAWAYKGLVWVGGPQVDPGYVGHLFCPIYNLSNKDVWIKKGDAIALMDFVKTTSFDPECRGEKPKQYRRPPKRVVLEDYEIDDFRSALRDQSKAIPKLEDSINEGLKEVRNNANIFTTLVIAIIAILMTVIMLPYFGAKSKEPNVEIMNIVPISLSLFAALLSLFTVISRNQKTWMWLTIVGTSIVVAAAAAFGILKLNL